MGKKRWQETEKKPVAAAPAAPRPSDAGAGRGRWRNRAARKIAANKSVMKAIIGFFGLGSIVTLIVVVIILLKPVRPPKLVILSATYRTQLLPPNAFAVEDARLLAAQSQTLDISAARPESLARNDMAQTVEQIKHQRPASLWWYPWAPSTCIVYANALGFSLWNANTRQATAYILPSDYEVPETPETADAPHAIAVSTIVKELVEAQFDYKILILDCQKVESIWPLGVLGNDFISTVKNEIDALPTESKAGLFVLFSCSENEVAWADPEMRQSVFGYHLARGLTQAAPDQESRINLQRLADNVKMQVGEWARQQRADDQTPILVSVGGQDASSVPLASLGRADRFNSLSAAAWDNSILDDLQMHWEAYFEMRKEGPSPVVYAPQKFRYLEDSLLRAEQFWRAQRFEEARNEIVGIQNTIDALRGSRDSLAIRSSAYSLPMKQFIADSTRGGPAAIAADDKFFLEVIKDALDQGGFAAAVAKLRDKAPKSATPPVEALWIRMVDDQLLAPRTGTAPSPEAVQRAQSLLKLRVQAERAAVPAGWESHLVFRWIKARVDTADDRRRLAEDLFLAGPAQQKVPLGNPPPALNTVPFGEVEKEYQRAIEDAEKVLAAVSARQAVLGDLPHLLRLAHAREWAEADTVFRRSVVEGVAKMLESARLVGRILDGGPDASRDQARIDAQIAELDLTSKAMATDHRQIVDSILKRTVPFARGSGPLETQVAWRAANDMLAVPFPIEEDAATSAQARSNLNQRVVLNPTQSGSSIEATSGRTAAKSAGFDELQARKPRVPAIAQTATTFYGLGLNSTPALDANDPVQLGYTVGSNWRRLFDVAASTNVASIEHERQNLVVAGAAQRIIDGYVTGEDPTAKLWKLDRAEFFLWHAARFTEDFWARLGDLDDQHYFARSAAGYLDPIEEDVPLGAKKLRSRIEELRMAADDLRVEADQAKVAFRGVNERSARMRTSNPAKIPRGIAGLTGTVNNPVISLSEKKPVPSEFPYGYDLKLNTDAKAPVERATLTGTLRFRGHTKRRDIDLVLPQPIRGPTVVYKDDRPLTANVVVRPAEPDRRVNVKVLFVLDCSWSMLDNDRMILLKQVLREFSEFVPQGSIDVGIRTLGGTVRKIDNSDPPQAAKTDTQSVLPIGTYDKKTFVHIVDELEAVGYTPLTQALFEGASDLNASGGSGKRSIILISDGQDTWAGRGFSDVKEFKDVEQAYRGSNIEINVIGFQLEEKDVAQLQRIARFGNGNGKYFGVVDKAQLFNKVTGLLGVLRFDVASRSKMATFPAGGPVPLLERAEPIPIPREYLSTSNGERFNLRVADMSDQTIGEKNNFLIRRGEKHDFIFRAGKLQYAEPAFPAAIVKNIGDYSLAVIRANCLPEGLDIMLSLFNNKDSEWRPKRISAFVLDRVKGQEYSLQNLGCNVAGEHLPVWRFGIAHWPADSNNVAIRVVWSDDNPNGEAVPISWNDANRQEQLRAPDPPIIVQYDYQEIDGPNGKSNGVVVRMTFPEEEKQIHRWSIGFIHDATYARQTYDGSQNIYRGEFVLALDKQPEQFMVFRPREERADNHIRAELTITRDTIR